MHANGRHCRIHYRGSPQQNLPLKSIVMMTRLTIIVVSGYSFGLPCGIVYSISSPMDITSTVIAKETTFGMLCLLKSKLTMCVTLLSSFREFFSQSRSIQLLTTKDEGGELGLVEVASFGIPNTK